MNTEPPHDIEAEQYVLAAMMNSPVAIESVVEVLDPEHFYRPAHEVIYRAMVNMHAAGRRIDPLTLRAWLETDGDMRVLGGRGALYLAELFELPADALTVRGYARLVLAAAMKRGLKEEASRIDQAASTPSTDPDDILRIADERMQALTRLHHSPRHGGVGYRELVEKRAGLWQPVIPGLLGAQDRVVVVAGEGRGKTTLAHQVAFCTAAGCHAFSPNTAIAPQRVLVADFENPTELLISRIRKLGETAASYPTWDEENIDFYLRPEGIDLSSAADAFDLMNEIRRFRPALLVAGPIYKLVNNLADDPLRAHARVARFFDAVRGRFGCAIWLEAHAPYGEPRFREMRPEGSNLWAKWPEFGISLYRATRQHGGDSGLDIKQFRGHRDERRPWPSWLTRNPVPSGWPWLANYERGVITALPPREDE